MGAYAEQDAVATLKLWEALKVRLEEEELWHIWDIENGLIPCLLDMRTNGVRVDLDKAEQNKALIKEQSDHLRKYIEKEAGMGVDIWASASIAKMFDKLGLAYPRTESKENKETGKKTGGAPSFTKSWLSNQDHKICRALVKLRSLTRQTLRLSIAFCVTSITDVFIRSSLYP